MLYVRYTHHLVQTSQHAPVLPSCTTHTRNRPREAGRLREDGGRKRRSRDSTPGPLFQSHARPLRTGQREQEPSLTGRDTGTRSHLPLMVRRLKQRQTPLCPLCRETQISSDSPDQSPRDTASPVTRPPPQPPAVTPSFLTPSPWPRPHTGPRRRVLSTATLSRRRDAVRLARTGPELLSPLPRLVSALRPALPGPRPFSAALTLQLRCAHKASLLTPPSFTPWWWGNGVP